MPTLLLGNESVLEPVPSGGATATLNGDSSTPEVAPVARPELGAQITSVNLPNTYVQEHGVHNEKGEWVPLTGPDDKPLSTTMWTIDEQLRTVREFVGQMFAESPSWVESDDQLLAQLVAREYGCPVGRPKGWEIGKGMSAVKGASDA
jgi:hypothetical protein